MAAPERSTPDVANIFGDEEEEEQFASNESGEISPSGVGDIIFKSHDQAQHLTTSRRQTSSRASSQASTVTAKDELFAESGDTGVTTSSAHSDTTVLQVNPQLGDSDSEDGDSDNSSGTEDSEEEDEETELVVLDPDHPLMTRFQSALKNYLTKQLQPLNLDVHEMSISLRRTKKEREELGVILYGLQQELAQLQLGLEKQHDRHSQAVTQRRQWEEELEVIREMYKKTREMTNEERKRVLVLQTEVENLSLRLFYVQSMKKDVLADIAVMKRVVHKAEMERMKAEDQKQKQDLYVDRQTRQVVQLNEQIAMYNVQIAAQNDDSKAARTTIAEANMEIDAIIVEKKQLLQQWNSSLLGMRKRDEALTAVRELLSEVHHLLRTMESEIEGFKRSAMKEEEKNEHLAIALNRAENEVNMNKKLLTHSLSKQEALKVDFSTYTRTLHETEHALNKVVMDRSLRWSEISAVRKQIEQESQTKMAMKNQILEKLQEKMVLHKAAKFSLLMIEKLRKQKFEQEMQFSKLENETAKMVLEINHVNSRLTMLQKTLSELDQEVQSINETISRSESEIAKRIVVIDHKQSAINLLSKQIESAMNRMGGEPLGPLEIQIKNLNKDIEDCSSQTISVQEYWLRLQNELVKLSHEREEQEAAVEMLKKELNIKQQQKVRLENEIQQEKNEKKDIERHMRNLSNDMAKLTSLLGKNNCTKEELEQSNLLMETDFILALKSAEKESIEMQEKRDSLQEEKERMLNNLVEAEHQIMLWEKKIQLAKEMRYSVDSSFEHGEIRAMKAEVRQMQLRYAQLMRQQELIIRDMEAVVARREAIARKGQTKGRREKHLTTTDLHLKVQELKKKMQETQKNAEECNGKMGELQETQKSLSATIAEKQVGVAKLQADFSALESDLERLQEKKRQNLAQIVGYQSRQKHLQAVKEGKYVLQYRSQQALDNEMYKQMSRMHTISTIIHQIQQEYPQYQGSLRAVNLALDARLGAPEETMDTA
ncbi:coiled-coil domain-containing protein 40 [Microcaecilia unicolor]|uniref:Coiled-coil domain-containing protein 40 n=1 Tax=Microcaecilia unicolor TaxID=1415580 RepID=A0A6P7Y4L7_9AMPH|nr:coiled-coil domain-containing protein 40 [Microcaecilia unicolor]